MFSIILVFNLIDCAIILCSCLSVTNYFIIIQAQFSFITTNHFCFGFGNFFLFMIAKLYCNARYLYRENPLMATLQMISLIYGLLKNRPSETIFYSFHLPFLSEHHTPLQLVTHTTRIKIYVDTQTNFIQMNTVFLLLQQPLIR